MLLQSRAFALLFLGLVVAPAGGGATRTESEPNDHLVSADPLGILPHVSALVVLGEIGHPADLDTFRIFVASPTTIDLRILTGAASLPAGSPGSAAGLGSGTWSASFLPIVGLYGPDGRLVGVFPSLAPNLLIQDLAVPLVGESFFLRVGAWPGSHGPYNLKVAVQ